VVGGFALYRAPEPANAGADRSGGAVPDQDIRAMAVYLASLSDLLVGAREQAAQVRDAEARAMRLGAEVRSPVSRLYDGACAVCHEAQP